MDAVNVASLWSAFHLTGYLANPFPPLQPLVIVHDPQFQPTPDTIILGDGGTEPRTIAWEQLTLKRSGGKVLCNDVEVFRGGAEQAKEHADFLLRVKAAASKKRAVLIETWMRQRTDAAAAKKRVELYRRNSTWLDLAINTQFMLLFIITPISFARFGSKALWPLVGIVLSTSVFVAWQFWRLHKQFFPSDSDVRFKSIFSAVLSPIYAIRAGDALARDLLAGFHPLVAAGVLCSARDFEVLAGEHLREIHYTLSPAGWYTERLQRALKSMVSKQGVNAQQLLAEPERQEECVVYCPRCRAQYTQQRESCADCAYSDLLPFANQELSANASR